MRTGIVRAALVCAVAFMLLPAPTRAGGKNGSITVGATVRPVAAIESVRWPEKLHITEEDIERGWVDIDPVAMTVRSNDRAGVDLDFAINPRMVRIAQLRGHEPEILLAAPRARLRRDLTGRHTLALRWRLHLSERARPGEHPWPIKVTATPASTR